MSAEIVVKKRGRPRKADKIDPVSGRQDGEVVTTPKRSTTSRSITTTKPSSKDAVQKKPARRKKLAEVDGMEAPNEQLVVEVNPPSTAKERQFEPSKSRILDEARAFKQLKASSAASNQIGAGADEQSEASSNKTGPPSNLASPPSASQSLRPARNITASEQPLPSVDTLPEPSPSETTKTDSIRSSFLSSFLSDAPDPIPEAPESSKFIDRSAFNAQSLSVNDIVSGEGVSDLTSLTAAAQPKANVKEQRESAIPITAAKSFQSHSLNTFPDKPQQQKVKAPPAQKSVNPEIYALGSFQKFKTSPQATTAPSASGIKSGTTTSTEQSPHIPPTTTLSQIQSKSQSNQKATIQTSSSPTPIPTPPKPQSQPQSPAFPSTPSTSSTLRPSPPLPPTATQPTLPPSEPHFRPKRPTEMTPAELLKNPEFKSLRRKYTGLIVGIPVLVVTSWLLWERMDREDKGLSLGEVPAVEEKRRRGELPKRILDDGGLERGR